MKDPILIYTDEPTYRLRTEIFERGRAADDEDDDVERLPGAKEVITCIADWKHYNSEFFTQLCNDQKQNGLSPHTCSNYK